MKKVKLKWNNIILFVIMAAISIYCIFLLIGFNLEVEKNKELEDQIFSIQNERALEYSQYQNSIRQNEALELTIEQLTDKIVELEDIIDNY